MPEIKYARNKNQISVHEIKYTRKVERIRYVTLVNNATNQKFATSKSLNFSNKRQKRAVNFENLLHTCSRLAELKLITICGSKQDKNKNKA